MAAVQALPPAPAAQTSPAAAVPAPSANPMATPWGAGALHQRLNSFVKKTLLQQLVPAGAVVCDLFCGRGVDTENWAEAQISKYVGVDLSASALEEAKEQWEKNGKPFAATFCELNPCMADLEKHLGESSFRADVVTCLAHLQDCFVSKDQVHCLLQNVSALLKPGGYFFGATPDSSTIWYKYQKAVEGAMKAGSLRANGQLPRVKTDLYSISFEDDRFHEYGSRYQLRFADESLPPQSQVLVHFPSLIRGAEEVGLEYVEIQNLYEFYEDYRGPFAETLQSSCGSLVDAKGHPVVDVKSRLSPVAQDVLSLYTTFIFKKPAPIQHVNPLQVPTPMSSSAAADIKRNGKKHSSSAVSIKSTAPKLKEEVIPRKKQRISSSTPEEGAPKGVVLATPEEIVKKEASKPAPVAMKHDNSRSGSRGSKSLGRDPKTGNSHPSMSSSKAEERVSKVVDSPGAVAAAGVMTTASGAQKHLESPLRIASKSKDVEQQRAPPRLGSPNPPKIEDSKRESSRGANKSLKASDKPSSSRRRSESQQRSDTSGRGNPESNPETDRQGSESGQSQDSLKRKREALGGRSYTPASAAASASAPVPVPSSGGDSNKRTNVERRSSQRRTGFYSSPSEQQQQERGSNPLPTTREPAFSHAGTPRGGDGDSLPKQAVNAPSASRTRETNAGRPQKKDIIAEHEESPPSTQKESSTTATTMNTLGGSSSSHQRKIVAVAKEEHPVATPPQKELERLMGGDDNKAGSTTAAAAAAMEAMSDGGAMMQAKEEAIAASEHPQKRERPVTELHYERRATQKRVIANASANVNKVINKRESETMTTEAAIQQPPPEREAATRKKATLVTTEAACFEGEDGVPANSSGQVTPSIAAMSQKLGLVSSDEHPPPDEKDVARKNETLLVTEGQLKGTKSQSSDEAMEVGLEKKDHTALGLGPDEKRHPQPREPQLEELATIESGTNVGVGVLGVLSEKFIAASHDNKVAAQKKGGSVVSDFVVEKRDHTVISDALPEKVLSQNREAFSTAGGESQAEKGAKRRRESNALDQPLLEEDLSQMRESNVAMIKHSTQRTESSSVAMTMEPVPSVRGSNQVNLEILEPRMRRGFSPKRGGMPPGDSHSSRNQGITKESEAAWPETMPQRYTRRRAMAAMAQAVEGGGAASVPENPPIWQNNRGTTFGAAQIEREQQQQQQQSSTPVFLPGRLPPFVTPIPSNFGSLSRPPVRSVVDRRDSNSKSHDGPGLLGAAPPHIIINSQRERRYDSVVGPSNDPTMVARNRLSRGGPMFINKERGSRNPSEFANSAPHSSGGPNNNNGPGMPWEEHLKGDSRSRNNR